MSAELKDQLQRSKTVIVGVRPSSGPTIKWLPNQGGGKEGPSKEGLSLVEYALARLVVPGDTVVAMTAITQPAASCKFDSVLSIEILQRTMDEARTCMQSRVCCTVPCSDGSSAHEPRAHDCSANDFN